MSTRLPIHPNTEGRNAFSTDFDLEKLLSSNEHVVTKSSGSDFAKTVIPLFTSHQSSRKENREKFYLNPECRIYERFKDC